MKYLTLQCRKRDQTILFAHNLEFDLGAILCKHHNDVFRWRKPPPIDVTDENGEYLGTIDIFSQKTWFASIKLKNGARIKVVDSANYIRGSLFNISRELNLPTKKSTRPESVLQGRSPINKKEWDLLILYCGREIKAEYELSLIHI